MQSSEAHCRLCGGPVQARANMTFDRFALSACRDCGFAQISPRPSDEELNALYGELYFQKAKYTDPKAIELEYQRRHRLMARAGLARGARLLEIGCGAGQFIATCVDDYAWHGVDVSAAGIERARERLPTLPPERLQACPIEQYEPPGLDDGGFDAVLIFDTIEHVYDPNILLEKSARWLKPSGHLIVSTPDIGAPMARLTGRRWPFMTPPEHLSFFTHRATERAFARHGLQTSYCRSFGKYANVAFIIYKAGRVGLLPKSFGSAAAKLGLGKLTVYVPTGDVLYAIAHKRAED